MLGAVTKNKSITLKLTQATIIDSRDIWDLKCFYGNWSRDLQNVNVCNLKL